MRGVSKMHGTARDRRLLVVIGIVYLRYCTGSSVGTNKHGLTGSASPANIAIVINKPFEE
jgi:hypothetical protein